MTDPNYCSKHRRQKTWMITSSFCPECDQESQKKIKDAGEILPHSFFEDMFIDWDATEPDAKFCSCPNSAPNPADKTVCQICYGIRKR